MNEQLVGFVYKHNDNTYSLWGVELTSEDADAINKILLKYQNDGVSVCGDINDISLEEVF